MGVSISPGLSPPGPFRGFAPFDESAADVFFGRSLEAAAVLERVLSQNGRVVTLTGESGVGKTSLVRAGVIPVLQKRGVPVLYLPDPTNVDAEVFRAGGVVKRGSIDSQSRDGAVFATIRFVDRPDPARQVGTDGHFAPPQQAQFLARQIMRQAVGHAAATATAIEAEHQPRTFSGAAADVRPEAKAPVVAALSAGVVVNGLHAPACAVHPVDVTRTAWVSPTS